MADFSQAHEFVKRAEGGYTADRRDAGNWTGGAIGKGSLVGTNHGISAPVLKAWLGRTPTVSDMKGLSYDTALAIYKKDYWDALSLSEVKNQSIALLIYDGAVNQGVPKLKSLVADSLTEIGIPSVLSEKADRLAQKVNIAPQQKFYDTLKQKRIQAYPKQSPFYAGWMNRVNSLGFFLTTQTRRFTQTVRGEVKRNPETTLFIVLLIATAITAGIVYKKNLKSMLVK